MHVHMLLVDREAYLTALQSMCDKRMFSTLSQAIKSRTIVALHITGQHKALKNLLLHCEVVEIVKAINFLDKKRQISQLERSIASIEEAHPHLKDEVQEATTFPRKRRKRKIDLMRAKLKDLQVHMDETHITEGCVEAHHNSAARELVDSASASGAFARKIRQWAKQALSKDFLEFVILTMPLGNWKKLADLVHFSPSDFSLPYFLWAVHGEELPKGSFVRGLQTLVASTDEELAHKYRTLATQHPQIYLSFNFLRLHPRLLRVREIAEDLARNIPLSTAIWYLEELVQSSSEIPDIVGHRLRTEDWMAEDSKVTASFGKLLERLLTFQSRGWKLADDLMVAAEKRLSALKEVWSNEQNNGVTVVFGDASSSMTSAIQAATILATMFSVCWGAELSFFNHRFIASPHPRPTTVKQTLQVCRTIQASGATSLAAALWPYFDEKRRIDRIVLVTDEEENTNCHGYNFARLLKAYMDKVQAGVELIVICVNTGDHSFRNSLVKSGIDCKRIEIDGCRPDLTKFDAMLGRIALSSDQASKEQANEGEADFVVV